MRLEFGVDAYALSTAKCMQIRRSLGTLNFNDRAEVELAELWPRVPLSNLDAKNSVQTRNDF